VRRNHQKGVSRIVVSPCGPRSADERSRTSTPLRALEPESSASANSATSAGQQLQRGILPQLLAFGKWGWVRKIVNRAGVVHCFAAPPKADAIAVKRRMQGISPKSTPSREVFQDKLFPGTCVPGWVVSSLRDSGNRGGAGLRFRAFRTQIALFRRHQLAAFLLGAVA